MATVATPTAHRWRALGRRRPRLRPGSGPAQLAPGRSQPAIGVAVFTTSYPRHEGDFAGRFVAGLVEQVRARGVSVEVVGPGSYRDFGLSADPGAGLVGNLRRRPWVAPFAFLAMVRALRRAARQADLVHANWLLGGLVARFAGKPFVVSLHGSGSAGRFDDLGLAARAPRFVRWTLGRAEAVICCSDRLAVAMRACGLDNVHTIPYGVDVPETVAPLPAERVVLYVGRLSVEKGIDVLAEATQGLPLVAIGDGPLRSLVPDALGFLPPGEVKAWYDRAAVIVLASRSEGLPNVVLEAMAHGRAVVATDVGGIPSLIEHGRTGLLVPAGDARALREALETVLSDADLCMRLGAAARQRIEAGYSWGHVARRTLAVYRRAMRSQPDGRLAVRRARYRLPAEPTAP